MILRSSYTQSVFSVYPIYNEDIIERYLIKSVNFFLGGLRRLRRLGGLGGLGGKNRLFCKLLYFFFGTLIKITYFCKILYLKQNQ